jgi:hypothetical protein
MLNRLYLSAVKGRRDMREGLRREREGRMASEARLKSLKWAVCESEVLRDPSLPPAARKILTELADLNL